MAAAVLFWRAFELRYSRLDWADLLNRRLESLVNLGEPLVRLRRRWRALDVRA